MKLDKAAAIAQLNQALGMSVLDAGNTLLARFNKSKNVWWFDIPLSQLKAGKFLNLLLANPAGDAVEHLKVPTGFLRQQQDSLELRDKNARRPTLSLELSADPGKRLRDVRPGALAWTSPRSSSPERKPQRGSSMRSGWIRIRPFL